MDKSHSFFSGGIENYRLGLLPQAKQMFLDCLLHNPFHAEARNLLGIVCYRKKEYHEALTHAQGAIAINPMNAYYHNNAGVLSHSLKQYDHARGYFTRAIDLEPLYPDPWNNLGNVLTDRLLFDEAILCYKRALTLHPFFAEACFNLALCLDRRSYTIEAIHYYRETLKIRPDHLKAHQRLWEILLHKEKEDEAEEHRSEVSRLIPLQKPFFIHTPTWSPPDFRGLFNLRS